MSLVNSLTRIFSSVVGKSTEGEYRPGPYYLPVTGGWLSAEAGNYWNWWQKGYDIQPLSTRSAMVEACVSAYSQTVAMCPGDHWRTNAKGGRDRVTTSALSRLLRTPNDYQSISDFLLNAVRDLYLDGNAYAYCPRNDRYEIDELHLMDPRLSRAQVSPDGSIFYQLGGNVIIENRLPDEFHDLIPARDVLHIRLHSSHNRNNPLLGESPIWAAAGDIAAGDALKAQQFNFFKNEARPSFLLSTDLVLDKDQVQSLRDRWNEQTRGAGAGGTPILTGGLKPTPITISSRDSQIAEMMDMTNQDIALAFRVPLALLGIGKVSPRTIEALMQEWLASGLGFCLNHVEEAFGQTFNLWGQPDEYVEFDTAALLRSAFKERIDALVKAVQGGVLAPNEARNLEGYEDVKYGDEPRVQQQVVPLSAASAIKPPSGLGTPPSGPHPPPSPGPNAPPPSGGAAAPAQDQASEKPPAAAPPARAYANVSARSIRRAAAAYERRGLA